MTVCIVNWNCRDLLRACLRSLLRQDQGAPLEVIVVDNASTDGAAAMTARDFPEVRLIVNDVNRGFAVANNQAAAAARGEFLFFLNNDTVVPAGVVGDLRDFLDAHPEVALVGPRLVGVDGRPQAAPRRAPTVATFLHRTWLARWTGLFRANYRTYRRLHGDAKWPTEVEMLLGVALLVRRQCFQALGGWDEGYAFGGEDLDFCWRARRHGPIIYDPRVAITHVGSASTKENITFAAPHILAGFARYFRKAGASRRALLVYKLAVTLDAPAQIVVKSLQAGWRRLLGRPAAAAKSWKDVKGAAAFLRHGLGPFWRA